MTAAVSVSKNGNMSWKEDAWSTQLRAGTFWLGFQPGKYLTSSPILSLNSWTAEVFPGLAAVGACLAVQKSHCRSRAKRMASSDAWPCLSTLTKSWLLGCPRFLWRRCNVFLTFSGSANSWTANDSNTTSVGMAQWSSMHSRASTVLLKLGTVANTADTNSAV